MLRVHKSDKVDEDRHVRDKGNDTIDNGHRNHGVGDVLMTLTVCIENECGSHFVRIDEQSADTLCRWCAHRQG